MTHGKTILATMMLTGWLAAGCDAETAKGPGLDGGGRDAAIDGEPDGGGGGSADGIAHDAYFAVLSDNYAGAVVISLLGVDGEVVDDAWLSPSVMPDGLRTPLAEDVVFPSVSPSRRYLTLIERSLGVVTRFDLETGNVDVVGQVRADASPEGDAAAFHANPQDVYYVDPGQAWISRWAKNADAKADAAEQGNDLVGFDPEAFERTDLRVAMTSLDTTVTETQFDENFMPTGEVESDAWARPSRLVPAGNRLVVGCVRMSDGYAPAEGATAIIDPVAGKITGKVALTGLKNCGEVVPVADSTDRALVGCIGDFNVGLGPDTGIVMLEIDGDGAASIVESYRVADHAGAAATGQYLASLGGTRVVAVASGSTDPTTFEVVAPDRAYIVDLATGTQELLYESTGAFSLGTPAFNPDTGILLIPDAGSFEKPVYGVRRFRVDGEKVEDDGFVEVAASTTLAARQVHRLSTNGE